MAYGFGMPIRSVLIATGSYLPQRVVTNADLAVLFPTSDEWIRKKTGIKERRFAASGEGVSDMACVATKAALKRAGLKAQDIDAIVFSTSTPDYHAPGSGILLQHKLGCRPIPAFDVRNTSPGFLYSLELADGLIRTGRYATVLVVGAEVHSTGLDFTERGRKMAVIFGDGCGCFLLRASREERGLKDFVLRSDGAHAKDLWCEAPSSLKNPRVTAEDIALGTVYPKMNGKVVFEHAVRHMGEATLELLKRNSLRLEDVDLLIPHQANLRVIETLRDSMKLSADKVPHNIENIGNTSSASIPILFDELVADGTVRDSQKIVLAAFGAGFCWGAALLET